MSTAQQPGPVDKRALLAGISHRQVNRVVSENTPYALALLDVALERQTKWTASEWSAVLDELDRTTSTVGDWLTKERAR